MQALDKTFSSISFRFRESLIGFLSHQGQGEAAQLLGRFHLFFNHALGSFTR
jgi:hypothetical protein